MTSPIAFVLGSDSDLDSLEGAFKLLDALEVGYAVRVLSAHRTPDEACSFARNAKDAGCKVLIGCAGMAAHLAGALAAHSRLPVLGVPVDSGPLGGRDALLSTVMMPPGIPVGTLGIGSSGAKNAALLAVRILALQDSALDQRLAAHIDADRKKTLERDSAVQARFRR
ncbi:MAG: 5-(carboxyamino)imidazole ribonucleotide mutase [Planctomycetes bacterium]|nr:5-(carboxyamino)imidazole ribonucleotide mutase [Planctomycetota bacterium]MCB9871320.1 5-(carboxyamino)imidazole ribonucleotide mutase [Planctomycetota bacterium]MCB9888575.1 5-(carboxyamino)imidazole ribonucleotide mutase [Planctomycetota bacterium]